MLNVHPGASMCPTWLSGAQSLGPWALENPMGPLRNFTWATDHMEPQNWRICNVFLWISKFAWGPWKFTFWGPRALTKYIYWEPSPSSRWCSAISRHSADCKVVICYFNHFSKMSKILEIFNSLLKILNMISLTRKKIIHRTWNISGIILCMCPANERWCYKQRCLSMAESIHKMIPDIWQRSLKVIRCRVVFTTNVSMLL